MGLLMMLGLHVLWVDYCAWFACVYLAWAIAVYKIGCVSLCINGYFEGMVDCWDYGLDP